MGVRDILRIRNSKKSFSQPMGGTMSISHQLLVLAALAALLPCSAGCCCYCRGSNPFQGGGGINWNAGGDADENEDEAEVDSGGPTSKERKYARNAAAQALSNVGYPKVDNAELRQDGLNWYVTGTARDPSGNSVPYEVHFLVTQTNVDRDTKQSWNVQTVTVDGNILYP